MHQVDHLADELFVHHARCQLLLPHFNELARHHLVGVIRHIYLTLACLHPILRGFKHRYPLGP